MRVGRFDRILLRCLLDVLQHRQQQGARCFHIALHRIQRDLRQRIPARLALSHAHVLLQSRHICAVGTDLRFAGRHHASDFGGNAALQFAELAAQAQHIGVVGAETAEHRLQLPVERSLLHAKLYHAGRDCCLRGRAGVTACGIQPSLGRRKIAPGVRQILRLMADLLRLDAGVHALHKALGGSVGGDMIFAGADFGTQFLYPAGQPRRGAIHRAMLGRQLAPHVAVHRHVDGRGRQYRAAGGERDLQHVRGFQRTDLEGSLHREQRRIALRLRRRAKWRSRRIRRGGEPRYDGPGQAACRRNRLQPRTMAVAALG